ncbi:DEAD-domain-containing protein [Massarina eburnea CBS 473.64]|uniref:DEAD-domain-containing protein n=1 Tax=Massarina eburnea CBS 473.64 TaxID=1395130 RepID=A0A6A6RPW3_9PLEO|nr:DEAD-domain-containing protein [Massarina eburnea CBS 473.64]
MNAIEIAGLEECIDRAIQEHLANPNLKWSQLSGLNRPVLRVEAFLEDAGQGDISSHSKRITSRSVDLSALVTPAATPSEQDLESGDQTHRRTADTIVEGTSSPEDGRHKLMQTEMEMDEPRRKGTGGLRISQVQSYEEDLSEHQRRMVSDNRNFPKRRKVVSEKFVFQPSTLDKLIIGIWEQIHGMLNLDPRAIFEQFQIAPAGPDALQAHVGIPVVDHLDISASLNGNTAFSKMNVFCRRVTQASRVCRSIEILVQARWTELFEEQVQHHIAEMPQISTTKHRKAVFMEACQDFGWSEKELRNKMGVWKGYKEVKDAAGWVALVFAGMGIYRFCKYRVDFDKDAMRRLQNLRKRLEVAADTLHPNWRQILSVIGVSCRIEYPGHPHDWVVFEDGKDPVPLRSTYVQQDPYFDFEQLDESIIDESVWRSEDPRWIPPPSNAVARNQGRFVCTICDEQQSDDPKLNACYCFPKLFGCVKRSPPPVQVYRTPDGRNNGLIALVPFERGAAIGEFLGLVTKGVRHLDVMEGSTETASYQIWQGRQGNFTRFINHSCKANAQLSPTTWLDTQRIVLVSKGIDAGSEIFVDYGDRYWAGLDKSCLCGETCSPSPPELTTSTLHPTTYRLFETMSDIDEQDGSRKRRRLSPPDVALPPVNTTSRIKAKKPSQAAAQTTSGAPSAPDTSLEKATFASIGVTPWLVSSLASMEIRKPTGIQKSTIPEILKGRDCIGGSRTGTGKTVAFSVPILQKWSEDPCGIYAVIITPTRELAVQIYEQVKAIGSRQSVKAILITGGADQQEQALQLGSRPHVVIATPGRLAEHVRTSGEDTVCGLRRVRFVVFDEADRLLSPDAGMLPDLETCLSILPKPDQRQTLLFTATVTPEVLALKERPRPAGRPPIFVCEVDTQMLAVPKTLHQTFLQTPVTHKECYLHVLLGTPENLEKSVIIFCNGKKTATLLEHMLRLLEWRVTSLHSDLPQSERRNNLARFRAQAAKILVATDVAARGLDIPEVGLVINYDIPRDPDDYIHRVGRTARAGRSGLSVTFVGQRDVNLIHAIEARVGSEMEEFAEEGVSVEGRVVRDALKPVTEKKREAMLRVEEGRDVLGRRQTGMKSKKRRA